jgi:hypothetical protein
MGNQSMDWEGFMEFGRQFRSAFPDGRHVFDHVVVEADNVVTVGRYRGTHRGEPQGIAPTGRQIESTVMHLDRVKGRQDHRAPWPRQRYGSHEPAGGFSREVNGGVRSFPAGREWSAPAPGRHAFRLNRARLRLGAWVGRDQWHRHSVALSWLRVPTRLPESLWNERLWLPVSS